MTPKGWVIAEFYNREAEYESYLRAGPAFVCNNLGTGPQYHRVHRSDCNMLNRAGPASVGPHTSVRKACSRDLQDLAAWLTDRFGPEGMGFAYCKYCLGRNP